MENSSLKKKKPIKSPQLTFPSATILRLIQVETNIWYTYCS